jgi:hypothetical protein
MNLSWRATVASSILILFSFAVIAQSSPVKVHSKLTVSFHNQSLEKVLEEITQKTGINFVYSANNVNPDKLISYTAVQQSLDDILVSLGQQMQLSFKWFGDHVVVKKIQAFSPPVPMREQVQKLSKEEDKFVAHDYNASFDSLIVHASTKNNYDRTIERKPFSFGMLSMNDKINTRARLDSMILSSLSLPNEKGKLTKPSALFASFGLYANDYTYTGLEIRMGTRSLHGILNASLVNNELGRVGYGVGTYFPSSSNQWSFSLDYTLSKLKKEKDVIINDQYQIRIYDDALALKSTQHQLKVQAHYTIGENVSLRFGPTINILKTRYEFQGSDIPVTAGLRYGTPFNQTFVPLSPFLTSSNTIIPPYTLLDTYSSDFYINTKLWFGFEAGISYRINFSSVK